MSTTPANIVSGVGKLYLGVFGAAEPADSSMSPYSPPDSAVWTDVGGTTGGMVWEEDLPSTDLVIDQLLDPAGARYTAGSRVTTLTVTMAEATLANIAATLNGMVTSTSGTGWAAHEPVNGSLPPLPTYAAVMLDGWAPGGSFRRRLIGRKALSKPKLQLTSAQDGKISGVMATWQLFGISDTIAPYKRIDQTA